MAFWKCATKLLRYLEASYFLILEKICGVWGLKVRPVWCCASIKYLHLFNFKHENLIRRGMNGIFTFRSDVLFNNRYNLESIQPWFVRAVIVETLQIVRDVLALQSGAGRSDYEGAGSCVSDRSGSSYERSWCGVSGESWCEPGGYRASWGGGGDHAAVRTAQRRPRAGALQHLGTGHGEGCGEGEANLKTKTKISVNLSEIPNKISILM